MDYKVLLFDLDLNNENNNKNEEDKEADEIRYGMSEESLAASPLLK